MHEDGVVDVVAVDERHPHPLADVHLVRVTADDVGGQSQSLLLVELDDRDRIRLLTGDPLLDVDRAGGHRAIAAHHCRRELGRKALWAWVTGWMDVETAAAAPKYPQLVVCAGFPEERRERIERGDGPRQQRIGDRASHLDRHRLAGTDQK